MKEFTVSVVIVMPSKGSDQDDARQRAEIKLTDLLLKHRIVGTVSTNGPPNPRLSKEQREEAIKRGMWYREDGRTFLCIEVAPGSDLSCRATREDALRKAEEKP